MLLQVRFHERAHGNDLELIEMSKVQRSANQLISQAASSRGLRDFSMDQRNAAVRAAVLQHGFLLAQSNLKLAFGFIVRNGIAIHRDSLLRLQAILREWYGKPK